MHGAVHGKLPMGPRISTLEPVAALPGGEVHLRGEALFAGTRTEVRIGGIAAPLVLAGSRLIVARVPEAAVSGAVELEFALDHASHASARAPQPLEIGVQIADNLHPVCNPAFDANGNIIVTLSGSRGQKTPVSLFRLDANFAMHAWSSAVMNPSGLALDAGGTLYVSSRHEGAVYRMSANGSAALVAEGLGVATGIAFDGAGDLYVGDRSGTIFKIDHKRNTFVFATLEPSIAAYHLAFGPDRCLYVSGPTTSSHDTIWRISPRGEVEPFFRGLGRPQGLAFEQDGDLLAVASHQGRRGLIRIDPQARAACCLGANNLVGLALTAARPPGAAASMILASQNALFHLPWPEPGLPLPPAHP